MEHETVQGQTGRIVAICTSPSKGTAKSAVAEALLVAGHGIEGDAHAGPWHRQVSLLSWQAIEAFRARGAELWHGCFGENLVVDGLELDQLPVGTQLACGDILLELTQIGKECHSHCQIFHRMGECIMPVRGVFTRVLHGGRIRPGDLLTLLPPG